MTNYYQCNLNQGVKRTCAYIEERGAKIGKHVEIKEEGFSGFWIVSQVSDKSITQEQLRREQQMNRNSFASIEPMVG